MNYITLNDGNKIPNDGSTYDAVTTALRLGYRHIDTAAAYFNEDEVGKAVRDSGIPRDEIFVTSKLWLPDYGYDAACKGIDASLKKLGLDYIDLYLIHQPYGDVPGAWKAMEDAQKAGKIKSIGVSNMTPNIWNHFVPQFDTMPAVNQVECHPFFQQKQLREVLGAHSVTLEAYFPLGHGDEALLTHPLVTALAHKYNKTAGQIILRFEVQEGFIVLPKSTNPQHMADNIAIFDFSLTDEDMVRMRSLDTGKGSHDPETPGMGDMLLNAYKVHD